jgi:glycerophosphoryl diester phosphodiesterase
MASGRHPQGILSTAWENVGMVAVLAHRGARSGSSENTLDAFWEARRVGADGVELDVRLSADGALVVRHDAEIPGLGPVSTLTVADLPAGVPLLEAAVLACGDLFINIELKDLPGEPGFDSTYPLAVLVAVFVVERNLVDRVVVSSFDLRAADAVRAVEPAMSTAWLTPGGFDQRRALDSVVARGHGALHPHHASVTPDLVESAHRAGVAINTWTVDEPHRMRELAAAGVDAIITNRAELAKAVLRG